MSAATQIEAALVALADPDRAATSAWFLQMAPGGYGEGGQTLGVRVPQVRRVVREHRRTAGVDDVVDLWGSDWHEVRLAGCVLAGELALRGDDAVRTALVAALLANTDRIDNWDLVDTVAPAVLGDWLVGRSDRSVLDTLAGSSLIWERRIAMVATLGLIRVGEHADALRLAEALLDDPHHLVHKASGWMLREVGLRDRPALDAFLDRHHQEMPRTMLRYAIEKHDPDEREHYLGRRGRSPNPPAETSP